MWEALVAGFCRYADFRGVSARSEFWYFMTLTQLVLALLGLPMLVAGMLLAEELVGCAGSPELIFALTADHPLPELSSFAHEMLRQISTFLSGQWEGSPWFRYSVVLTPLVAAVLVCPSLALTCRRLRDAGRSPLWVWALVAAMLPIPCVMELGCLFSLYVLRLCALPTSTVAQLPPRP